jgi:hypothetical protein
MNELRFHFLKVRDDGSVDAQKRCVQLWSDTPGATDRQEARRPHDAQGTAKSCNVGESRTIFLQFCRLLMSLQCNYRMLGLV